MADEWMTVSEASEISGYHAEHIRRLIRSDELKARKVVIVWLVNKPSLLAYLKRQEVRGEKRGAKPKD
jgi:excisionase family DNA binding protein